MTRHAKTLPPPVAVVLGFFLVGGWALALSEDSDQNWPQWRGPTANGVAPRADPPIEWGEDKNIRWKVALPGLGSSTPVVWGDRVFVTSAVDTGVQGKVARQPPEEGAVGRRHPGGTRPETILEFVVMALDRADGSVVWRQVARKAQPHEGTHPDGTFASPSPVTDGELIFAFFGSHGLYAYDFDGNLQWEKDLGDMRTRLGFGEGSSPAIAGDLLVINWDHEGDSFIVALDRRTGKERWRQRRDEGTSWATPLVVEQGGRSQVIVNATNRVRSYDAASGEPLWETAGPTLNVIPSPVHRDGVVYITSGFRGSSLMAIRLAGAKGDVAGTESILWTMDRDTPYVPSPLLYGDTFYMLKSNKGLLTAVDVPSGRVHYGPERTGEVRNIYASPVGAANRVYLLGRDGKALVIKHGTSFEILASNTLEDAFDASPAIVGDEIFLRGRKNLYCIAAD